MSVINFKNSRLKDFRQASLAALKTTAIVAGALTVTIVPIAVMNLYGYFDDEQDIAVFKQVDAVGKSASPARPNGDISAQPLRITLLPYNG